MQTLPAGLVELQKLISTGQDKNLLVLGVGGKSGRVKEFAAAASLRSRGACRRPTLSGLMRRRFTRRLSLSVRRKDSPILQGSDATLAAMLASLAEKQLQRARPRRPGKRMRRWRSKRSQRIAKSGLGYSLLKEVNLPKQRHFRARQEFKCPSCGEGRGRLGGDLFAAGQLEKAKPPRRRPSRGPDRVMSYLVNANVLHQQGSSSGAGEIVLASRQSPAAIFLAKANCTTPWQPSEENKQLKNALVSYKQAVDENRITRTL